VYNYARGTISILPAYILGNILCDILLYAYKASERAGEKHREFVNSLKKGMKIITEGGFFGTIVEVKEKTAIVKLAENVTVEVLKDSIVAKQPKS
jgi:preprotein translocase subunit YajC